MIKIAQRFSLLIGVVAAFAHGFSGSDAPMSVNASWHAQDEIVKSCAQAIKNLSPKNWKDKDASGKSCKLREISGGQFLSEILLISYIPCFFEGVSNQARCDVIKNIPLIRPDIIPSVYSIMSESRPIRAPTA